MCRYIERRLAIAMWSLTFYYFFIYFVSYVITRDPEMITYEGAQVWRTNIRTKEDFEAIGKLIGDQVISLWRLENSSVDFLVQADKQRKVNYGLNAQKLSHSVLIEDVQRNLEASKVAPPHGSKNPLRSKPRFSWSAYPELRLIDEYIVKIEKHYSSICSVTIIGHSVENKPIKMVKISNGQRNNKVLLLMSGMHGREWVAITSVLYVLDKILSDYKKLPGYMTHIDWHIIPLLNPDGYDYSHSSDRFWRKNRQKLDHTIAIPCVGVDLNRNFGYSWDMAGITDKFKCSEEYAGPHAFSEPETIAIRDSIIKSVEIPTAMLHVKSYGQGIVYPWSCKANPAKDRQLFQTTALAMSKAIKNATNEFYGINDAFSALYPTSGTCIDWMYSVGVRIPFSIMLRDKGRYAFALPPEFIVPTGEDLLAAVKELAIATNRIKHGRLGMNDQESNEKVKDNTRALEIGLNVKIDIGHVQ